MSLDSPFDASPPHASPEPGLRLSVALLATGVAGGLAGSFLADHGAPIFLTALVDAVLVLLAWLEDPRFRRLARWRGTVGVAVLFPLLTLLGELGAAGFQLGLGLALWLFLYRAPGKARAAAACCLFAVGLALQATALAGAVAGKRPLTLALLRLRGQIDESPLGPVAGREFAYRLEFPSGDWYRRTAAQTTREHPQADLWATNPHTGAELFVFGTRVPGALLELEEVEKSALELLGSHFGSARRLGERPLSQGFEFARLVRASFGENARAAALGVFVERDKSFVIAAVARGDSFAGTDEAHLESTIASFTLERAERPIQAPLAPEVVDTVRSAVALVLTRTGSGSGVLVSRDESGDGFILTNAHVVGALDAEVGVVFDSGSEVAEVLPASVLALDPRLDLALLGVTDIEPERPTLPLAAKPAIAPSAVVVGFPFGTLLGVDDLFPAPAFHAALLGPADGLPAEYQGRVVMRAGINPGNSGGPVVDASGTIIGLAVAKFVRTEIALIIPIGQLRSFLDQHLDDWSQRFADAPPAPAPPPERAPPQLSDEARGRARAALALVTAGDQRAAGFVLGKLPDGELLVMTEHDLVHDRAGRRRPVRVSLAPGTPHARSVEARILRSDQKAQLSLLAVPAPDAGIAPLAMGDAVDLVETTPLWMACFRSADFESHASAPPPELRAASLASARFALGLQLSLLQLDAGANRGHSGGPVLDASGAVVGLVVSQVAGTNLTEAVPGQAMQDFLRGALRCGALLVYFDGLDACAIDVYAEVDDPLGSLRELSLVTQDQWVQVYMPGDTRIVAAVGDELARASIGADGQVRMSALLRPCSGGKLIFQIGTVDRAGAQVLSRPQEIEVYPFDHPSHALFEGTYQAGDVRLSKKGLQVSPLLEPEGWRPRCWPQTLEVCLARCEEGAAGGCAHAGALLSASGKREDAAKAALLLRKGCEGGAPDACVRLAYGAPAGEAEALFSGACEARNGEGCRELARLALGPRGDTSRGRELLERACELGDAPGCSLLWTLLEDKALQLGVISSETAFHRACYGLDGAGCAGMARILANGTRFSPPNPTEAARLEREACRLGHRPSCGESEREPESEPAKPAPPPAGKQLVSILSRQWARLTTAVHAGDHTAYRRALSSTTPAANLWSKSELRTLAPGARSRFTFPDRYDVVGGYVQCKCASLVVSARIPEETYRVVLYVMRFVDENGWKVHCAHRLGCRQNVSYPRKAGTTLEVFERRAVEFAACPQKKD